MIEYTNDDLSALQSDALVVEVDCVGGLASNCSQPCKQFFPDIVAAYKQAFDEGRVEPGRLLHVERGTRRPSCVFLFPTKVHGNGKVREEFISAGINELMELVLKFGIKSIAIPRLGRQSELDWPQIKLRLLSAFARVPDIKLLMFSPGATVKPTKQIAIFTDGGAEPNPGVGGYGVVMRFGDTSKELSAGFQRTSNNRMELLAAITGLEALKEPCRVRLHSDSRYVIDIVNDGLLFRLAAKNWKSSKAKNLDLWQRFLVVYLRHEVEMVWVKGHAGIADNERCDQLATLAMSNGNLTIDQGYVDRPNQRASTEPLFPAKVTSERDHRTQSDTTVKVGRKPKRVGDPCRHCHTPLIRREAKNHKRDSAYWYDWYLYCESCRRMYHVDEAKVYRKQ